MPSKQETGTSSLPQEPPQKPPIKQQIKKRRIKNEERIVNFQRPIGQR